MLELLAYNFRQAGFEVECATDGLTAGKSLRGNPPALAVLDWMLPGRSGLALCRDLRRQPAGAAVPVILLTARTAVEDRVRGLECGADDYIAKPFAMEELLARARAVLRRTPAQHHAATLQAGGILLDRSTRRVRCHGTEVHLGPKEFGILELLMREPGRVYSREELIDVVWGDQGFVGVRTVDAHVTRLRRALRGSDGTNPIRTIRLGGYALNVDR